jgi:hypothetical protein
VLKKDKDLERADKLLWQARDLIGKGPKKIRRAAKLLQKVIAVYARRFQRMEDFTLMTEVLYEAAIVFDALRQKSKLRKVLKWLYTLRPDTIFDPRVTTDSLLKAAKNQGERIRKIQGGTVLITTKPAGARVFIDGVDRGVSPIEVDVAVGGQHFIVAQIPGYKPAGKRVRLVRGRKPKKVKLKLSVIPRPKRKRKVVRKIKISEVAPLIAAGRFNRPTMNMLARMCKQSNANVVLISHIGALSQQYVYSPFLYLRKERKLIKVKPTLLPKTLATLQISLLTIPDRLGEAIQNSKRMPQVRGKPEAWKIKPPPPPKPKPIPAPLPIPVSIAPAPTPRPVVTPAPVAVKSPQPQPQPVVVVPTQPPVNELAIAPGDSSSPNIAAIDERPGFEMPAVFKKWWFWTGAAVIIGGGVTTAILLKDEPGFNTVVRW